MALHPGLPALATVGSAPDLTRPCAHYTCCAMDASQTIREAMTQVAALRQQAADNPDLALALQQIKQLQAARFAHNYADLLASDTFAPSARFFLEELYSARDYRLRDQQFARIATALELTFPAHVVSTAVALAQLHQLTETLDMGLARAWLSTAESDRGLRYVQAWRSLGHASERGWQLDTVLQIGQTLTDLTRKRSLRMMLKMMRQPARLAGLEALQVFLETGFDRFAGMNQTPGAAAEFLRTVQTREAEWIARLFDPTQLGPCSAVLAQALDSQ